MRLLPASDQKEFKRSGGRTFKEIIKQPISYLLTENCVIHAVKGKTTNGFIDSHCHEQSIEIFIFPEGGYLTVNNVSIEFKPWDAILLEPGDTHGYNNNDSQDTMHIAIRIGPEHDKQS